MSEPRRLPSSIAPWPAVALAVGAGACGGEQLLPPRGDNVVDQLIHEASQVAGLISAPRLLLLALLVGLAIALTRVGDALIRTIWRLGLDPGHRMGPWRRLTDFVVFGALASWLFTRLLAAAPVLTGLAAIIAVAGGLWALARPLEDLAAGLGIVLRGRIHEGDHLTLGATHGTVQEVGLLRLVLRDPEGATLYVPHRLIDQAVVQVHRDRRQVPVSVQIPLDRPPSWDELERLRRAAALSPWRIPATPVRVEVSSDRSALSIEIQTWTEGVERLARSQLLGLWPDPRSEPAARRSRDTQPTPFDHLEREP